VTADLFNLMPVSDGGTGSGGLYRPRCRYRSLRWQSFARRRFLLVLSAPLANGLRNKWQLFGAALPAAVTMEGGLGHTFVA